MSRRPALFTQADLARVFAAAKRMGMAVRVDLVRGVADVVPADQIEPPRQVAVEPRRIRVL